MREVGYTLEAKHEATGKHIISIRLAEADAKKLINALWAHEHFWGTPGGGSVRVETVDEAEAINRLLPNYHISFDPENHRWHFHVHLI
jgi:hypothetical protein